MNAIEIRQLRKTYSNGLEALKGIDLTVKKGGFFGLLGPNGAGKSTIIGILSSLVNKTSGDVRIGDYNIDQDWISAKSLLGIVPQEFNFNIFEPCIQIVVNQAGYYGVPRMEALKRAEVLFDQLELLEKWDAQASQLSGGLKRRLMIARALIHNPEILILDEPTAGVDISFRRSMWDFLVKRKQDGLTIILTTHYLEEAEALCQNIAIIDKGQIIENTSKRSLLEKLQVETFLLECSHTEGVDVLLAGLSFRIIENDVLELNLSKEDSISDVILKLNQGNVSVRRIQNKVNRLEELFVRLVESGQ